MRIIKLLIVLVFIQFHPAAYEKAMATELLLAEVASKNIDPSAYLVSEKLDGVRAIWNGKDLRFRSGNIVPAPAWFIAALPNSALDGELWLARGQFEALSGMVRTYPPDDQDWRQIQYQVFELPNAAGTFAQRYQRLQEIVAATKFAQLHVIAQKQLLSNVQLRE